MASAKGVNKSWPGKDFQPCGQRISLVRSSGCPGRIITKQIEVICFRGLLWVSKYQTMQALMGCLSVDISETDHLALPE